MTEILAFVLGVSAVAFVWGVMVAFKTASKVTQIEKAITEQQEWILRNDELINRRVDQEIDRTDRMYSECTRHTDSRVDRLEHKYLEQTQSKKLIKG